MNRQRVQLIDRLEQSGKDYVWNLSQVAEAQLYAVPAPGEWTIHQVVAHMRDAEQYAFLVRVQRILKEENPTVASFDQEAWAREHYSPQEPVKKIITEFRATRRKLVRLLRNAPAAAWKNWATHSEFGRISLDWLAMHDYHHTLDHIAQLGRIREKQVLESLQR